MSSVLVVYSGGLDSYTLLNKAIKNFDRVEAITFNYGQKHNKEIEYENKNVYPPPRLRAWRVWVLNGTSPWPSPVEVVASNWEVVACGSCSFEWFRGPGQAAVGMARPWANPPKTSQNLRKSILFAS